MFAPILPAELFPCRSVFCPAERVKAVSHLCHCLRENKTFFRPLGMNLKNSVTPSVL